MEKGEVRQQETPQAESPEKRASAIWQTGGMAVVLAKVSAVGPVVATRDPTRPMELGFSQEELLNPPWFYFHVCCDGMPKPLEVWSITRDESRQSRQALVERLEDFWMEGQDLVEVLPEEITLGRVPR